jgi:ribosomal-protein-alanine N-acetyltransferase
MPTLPKDLTLRTKRLELRPFEADDAQAVFDVYASDPETTRYMAFRTHADVSEAREFIALAKARLNRGEAVVWAIRLRNDPALIGGISLEFKEAATCEAGYIIGRAYWGRGIVPEALERLLAFAREQLQQTRAIGRCDVENPKSGRVFEKCGFRQTGIARSVGIHPNTGPKPRDVYTFERDLG